jgi:TRAP-type C4-dicarboxylate transport system permease small subunit
MFKSLRKFFESALEYFLVFLMVILTAVVVVAVIYRLLGARQGQSLLNISEPTSSSGY